MREKNQKRLNRKTKNILLILIKVDKGEGGGVPKCGYKKFLIVNFINIVRCG